MSSNKNPVYDNDYVTLGYLKEYIESPESSASENMDYSKNFGATPVPPYHVNDTWTNTDGKVYVCITERLVGSFNINDWKIVVDTEGIKETLKPIYDVNKLEYATQTDGKIETFYQDEDPSVDWVTYVDKDIHLSDLWQKTNGKQYQYIKLDTNPVTYEWANASVPMALFDVINGHKTIFLVEPSDYKTNDYWLSDIAKIAINNNESFNPDDWVARDDIIIGEYKEYEEYHEFYMIPKVSEIDKTTSTLINKATDAITIQVAQEYITQTSMEGYVDGKFNGIQDTYYTKEEVKSEIDLSVGAVTGRVSVVEENYTKLNEDVDKANTSYTNITRYFSLKPDGLHVGLEGSPMEIIITDSEIKFMTGSSRSAYINNNELYISDNTILNKQTLGKWETQPDSEGNLNTRWKG